MIHPDKALAIMEDKLRFLISEYGFTLLRSEKAPLYATIIYKKNSVAIEGRWDVKEQCFEVKISLLDENGQIPTNYAVDENGRIIRGYITQFLPEENRDFGGRAKKSDDMFQNEINRFLFLAENYVPNLLKKGCLH